MARALSAGRRGDPASGRALHDRQWGRRIPNKIETVSGAFGRVYTRRTDAVWIISSGVVQNETADGHLVRLPFDTDMTKGPVGLMTRPDTQPGAEEQVFRLAVQTVIEELGLSS